MTNAKTTKRALLTSIMSLLLCFSMLLGTTYAWFTDSVSSANNIITAGNLDITLEYYNGSKWVDVQDSTELFDPDALWEPGHTEVVYLKLENKGTLALAYQLGVNIAKETLGTNVNGNVFKLSQYINLGVVELKADEFFATREEAIKAAEATVDTELEKVSNAIINGYTANGIMTKETAKTRYLALVVYMPKEVGNNVNYMTGTTAPQIELGVNVFATQYTYESDSFGKDYDANVSWANQAATYEWYDPTATEATLDSVSDLIGFVNLVNGTATSSASTLSTSALNDSAETAQESFKGWTITLNSDIDLQNKAWTPIGNSTHKFQGVFDGNGHTIKNLYVPGTNSNVGLFGMTTDGEIKNLTIENAKVSGRQNVGVVAGTPYTSKYTNITVKGHVEVDGMAYVGGVGGKNAYASWDNITVNVDDTSFVRAISVDNCTAYRTYVGGVIGFMGEGSHKLSNVTSNIDVIGSTIDVGGLVGIAHYGNSFENCEVSGNVTITNAQEAADVEEMGGLAGVWNNADGYTVTFTNCEFTGKLSANITEGVDLSNNTITGKPYSASGKGVLIIDGVHNVASQEKLAEALNNNVETIILRAGTYTFPALPQATTLICDEGAVFEGTSSLNINGSTVIGANFVNKSGQAVSGTINGTFKDCTFDGTETLRWCYTKAGDTVVFENCVINTTFRGVHFDGMDGDVIFRNCEINGFNAYSGSGTITFEGCTFGYSNSGYNGLNIYSNTNLVNCTFNYVDGKTNFIDMEGTGKTLTITNCVAKKNGELINITSVVGGSKLAQNTVTINGSLLVVELNALKEALASGATEVVVGAGEYTFPTSSLKEGTTLICEGTVFTGNSKLNINGATVVGATFSNPTGSAADQTINGTFKNCTFTGSNGLRYCYAGETVVFENCVFDGAVYGAHFDGGANEVLFKNCTFSGFNAFAGGVTKLTLDGCTFKSNGRSGYNGANLFGSTDLINCTFIFDGSAGTEWIHARGTEKTYNITNCVVTDGVNVSDLQTVFSDNGTNNTVTFN